MNETEQISVLQASSDLPISFESSRMEELLCPQFPSLLRNCHALQAGPLERPKTLALLSSGSIPNDYPWSTPIQEKVLFERKLMSEIDARAVDYRCDISNHSSETNISSDISWSQKKSEKNDKISCGSRLNKFVRRLYDMLCGEKNSGVVQWRRGLLILLDTKLFAKQILPKYFNTRNFKTFRRQLNYYGFVHVRSYSNTGSKSTTALWVNQELATGNGKGPKNCTDLDSVASVLQLKRVEPCDSVKTSEGRRVRKELALITIEDDLGVSPQTIQLQQLCMLSKEHTKVDSQETFPASSYPRRAEHPFVEHHNWSHMATTAPVSQLQESFLDTERSDQFPLIVSGNSSCRVDSSNSNDSASKPPTSSASVANLLLLLSSG